MKKILIITAILITSANATNEFNLQRLGKAVETLYIKYDKKILNLQKQLKEQNTKILKLEKNIQELKVNKEVKIIPVKVLKEKLSFKKLKTVNRRAGISSYLFPYNDVEIVNNYLFNQQLEIDNCNSRGWCKILNKDEYIKQYLLR